MFEVRVTADFAAAHFLRDYHGKCENLHGHNYKVYAHVRGENLDEGGMLMDFSELKKALRKVVGELDHTRIALFIYGRIVAELPGLKFEGDLKKPHLCAVDVFETEGSRARYVPYGSHIYIEGN